MCTGHGFYVSHLFVHDSRATKSGWSFTCDSTDKIEPINSLPRFSVFVD